MLSDVKNLEPVTCFTELPYRVLFSVRVRAITAMAKNFYEFFSDMVSRVSVRPSAVIKNKNKSGIKYHYVRQSRV